MTKIDIPASGVVLFHFWPSLCSQKVRLVLAEKGVDYESRLVNIGPPMENYDPGYVTLNPGAVIPTLAVNGEVITSSLHIMGEIDRRFGGPSLLPAATDPVRATIDDLLRLQDVFPFREHAYGTLTGAMRLVTRATMHSRIRKLRAMKARAPDLAAAYDRKIADVEKWNVTMRDRDEVAKIDVRAEALLDRLEQNLSGSQFLGSDRYSLADAAWTVIVSRLQMQGRQSWWEGGRRPLVDAWYRRMRDRPSFVEATIWDRMHFKVLAPIVMRVLLPRLAIAFIAVAALVYAVWLLFNN